MLTYALDDRGELPLYLHLYRCIRGDILSGALPPESRLPSKRALAEHLGVSVLTVETAYSQLVAEGYVHAAARRGFFVSPVETAPTAPATPPVIPEAAAPQWRLDLEKPAVDASRFPVSAWTRLTRQVLSEGTEALLSPVPHQGLPLLRQAIARDLRERKGMAVSPEQIVVGAGAEYLYLLLAQLLGRDTVLAVEDPGYPKIRQVYATCGVPVVPIPLDRQGVPPEALRQAGAAALHLSPSHHYPTGLVTPIARRQALLRWAESCGGFLIEDDYDSEFRFSGRPLPTLQSIDHSGRVIYMNTFSQTISPAMRMGFMVLPPALLARYRQELNFSSTVPALEQQVLARFLLNGGYGQHLSRMRKEYKTQRMRVLSAFRESPFAQRIQILEQGAGLHFLLRLQTGESEESLRQRGRELGVRLVFLSQYAACPRPEYGHILIVNYAGMDAARLPEVLRLLGEIFR